MRAASTPAVAQPVGPARAPTSTPGHGSRPPRHGGLRGQVDSSAYLIRGFERLGWARDVRWPDAARLATQRAGPAPA